MFVLECRSECLEPFPGDGSDEARPPCSSSHQENCSEVPLPVCNPPHGLCRVHQLQHHHQRVRLCLEYGRLRGSVLCKENTEIVSHMNRNVLVLCWQSLLPAAGGADPPVVWDGEADPAAHEGGDTAPPRAAPLPFTRTDRAGDGAVSCGSAWQRAGDATKGRSHRGLCFGPAHSTSPFWLVNIPVL